MMSALLVLASISCALAANVPIRPIPLMDAQKGHSRITGGQEVIPHSVPYQAALFLGDTFCGGTLISPRWVLTAGHCGFNQRIVQVVLGAHKLMESESTQYIMTSSNIIVHYGFTGNSLENDVALIQLASDAPLNDNIGVVQLAAADAEDYAGKTATASGWGKTSDSSSGISEVLRKASFPVLTNDDCQTILTNSIPIFDSMLCIDGAGGKSVCNGDSGGPLVVDNIQIGVSSFVTDLGCQVGRPAGFTRVSSFRGWIEAVSGV